MRAVDAGHPRTGFLFPERSCFDGYARQVDVPRASGSLTAACSSRGDIAILSMPDQQGPAAPDVSGTTSDGLRYEVRRMTASLLRLDAAGAQQAEIPKVVWGEFIAGRQESGGLAVLPRPLGPTTSFAFAGDRLIVASTDSGRVDVYDRTGASIGRFVVNPKAGAPSKEQYERAIAAAISIVPAVRQEPLTAFAKTVPLPERLPAFSHAFGDSTGLIWLVTSLDGEPVTRLEARRPTGEIVASLAIPFEITLFEVGTDYILGRTEDADGEQEVMLYSFQR